MRFTWPDKGKSLKNATGANAPELRPNHCAASATPPAAQIESVATSFRMLRGRCRSRHAVAPLSAWSASLGSAAGRGCASGTSLSPCAAESRLKPASCVVGAEAIGDAETRGFDPLDRVRRISGTRTFAVVSWTVRARDLKYPRECTLRM